MLSCKENIRGFSEYVCPSCGYVLLCRHTCKSRFCSSCGKKATDEWIQRNFDILPTTTWQHITLTMPKQLWNFFHLNRYLLNKLSAVGADTLQSYAKSKGIFLGLFIGLHTFGGRMNANIHLHISTATGGLTLDHSAWKKISFHKASIMKMWRKRLIDLFRKEYKKGKLTLPPALKHVKNYAAFNSFLDFLYAKTWIINIGTPSDSHKRNVKYLGKYLKRPVIGNARIKNYDGQNVTFQFHDHHTNTKQSLTITVEEFIRRTIMHIPDKGFRMIRYYGWLSNNKRGELLPLVFKLLGLQMHTEKFTLSWRVLYWETFGKDPILCPYCKVVMLLVRKIRPQNLATIMMSHKELATRQS